MIKIRKINENDFIEFNTAYYNYKNVNIDINYVINHVYNQTYIALDDNKMVGFIIFAMIYDRCELIDLYVDKKYRGKGIAKELINIMIDISKDCDNISLEVRKDNIEAYNLYSKFGFKTVSVREKYYNGIDGYLMVKEVNKK